MIVIGRGLGLAIAQEAALKLKETSGIQAEAFSSAEVRHGPMELIERDYPLLVFAPPGPEQESLLQLARDMRARRACCSPRRRARPMRRCRSRAPRTRRSIRSPRSSRST